MNNFFMPILFIAGTFSSILILWRAKKYFWDGKPKNKLHSWARRTFWIAIVPALIIYGIAVWQGVANNQETSLKAIEASSMAPLEKIQSLEDFLNTKTENDGLLKVILDDYNPASHYWIYTVMILDKNWQQEPKREAFGVILQELFVRTAQWDETALGVAVNVLYPVLDKSESPPVRGKSYLTDSIGLANIRQYPALWDNYTASTELLEVPK